VALLAACATTPPPKPPPPPPKTPQQEVRAVIDEAYAAVRALEPERLGPLLAPDVLGLGLGPLDVFTTREALVEHLRRELMPAGLRGDLLALLSSRPVIGLAEGGASAWFHDLPLFERSRPGKSVQTWAPRITGHLVKEQGSWHLDALQVSVGFPDDRLYAPGTFATILAPTDPPTRSSAGSEQLQGLTRRLLDDIAVKIERTSPRAEVILIGTDPADLYEDGAAFKALVKPRLPELKKAVFSTRLAGGPMAVLAADGKSGFVAATVVLKLGAGKAAKTLPPFRTLWVFAEEKGLLNLVQEHQALALKPEQREPLDVAALDAERARRAARAPRTDPVPAGAALDAGSR
jgi:hypothetical protein